MKDGEMIYIIINCKQKSRAPVNWARETRKIKLDSKLSDLKACGRWGRGARGGRGEGGMGALATELRA